VSRPGRCPAASLLISAWIYPESSELFLAVNVMWYLIAADLVLVVHLLFIGFVVGGSFLAWRWPQLIWVQLPAMAYGALIELAEFACPLTALQNYLLHRGGQAGLPRRVHLALPDPGDLPARPDPRSPARARNFRHPHRGDRIRRLPAPAPAGPCPAGRPLISNALMANEAAEHSNIAALAPGWNRPELSERLTILKAALATTRLEPPACAGPRASTVRRHELVLHLKHRLASGLRANR
jgi:Protein of Unknown function (DUF2784)